ncbi:hypothetical protein EC988_010440, partial [Linderina pennispora]
CKTNPATKVSELNEVWTYFHVQDLNTYIGTQPVPDVDMSAESDDCKPGANESPATPYDME